MRKTYIIALSLLLAATTAAYGRELRLKLENAGTLDSLLTSIDRTSVTSLILSGELNKGDQETLTTLTGLTDLVLPAMPEVISPSQLKLDKLRHLTYEGDVDFVSGQSYVGCPSLETVEYKGAVGHTDGYCFFNCPELRSIAFRGPVISTGGALFMGNCPKVEEVILDGIMISCWLGENDNCPSFKGYKINGIVMTGNDNWTPSTAEETIKNAPAEQKATFAKVCDQTRRMMESDDEFIRSQGSSCRSKVMKLGEMWNMKDIAETIPEKPKQSPERIRESQLTKLELLKESKPYAKAQEGEEISFRYASSDDSLLTATRTRFNLDSVAGNGSDLSKIKNLLHFVHESVRHDGGSS